MEKTERSKGYYTKLLSKMKKVENDPKAFQDAVISTSDYLIYEANKRRGEMKDILMKFEKIFYEQLKFHGDEKLNFALASMASCQILFYSQTQLSEAEIPEEETMIKAVDLFRRSISTKCVCCTSDKIGEDIKSLKYAWRFAEYIGSVSMSKKIGEGIFEDLRLLFAQVSVPDGEAMMILTFVKALGLRDFGKQTWGSNFN